MPAEMLLKIDHCAKAATPTTANIEEVMRRIWSLFTPQIMIIDINAKILKSRCMYLITKLARCSNIEFILAYLRTNLVLLILKIK